MDGKTESRLIDRLRDGLAILHDPGGRAKYFRPGRGLKTPFKALISLEKQRFHPFSLGGGLRDDFAAVNPITHLKLKFAFESVVFLAGPHDQQTVAPVGSVRLNLEHPDVGPAIDAFAGKKVVEQGEIALQLFVVVLQLGQLFFHGLACALFDAQLGRHGVDGRGQLGVALRQGVVFAFQIAQIQFDAQAVETDRVLPSDEEADSEQTGGQADQAAPEQARARRDRLADDQLRGELGFRSPAARGAARDATGEDSLDWHGGIVPCRAG